MTPGTATTATIRRERGTQAIDAIRFMAVAAAQIQSWAATTEGRRRTGRVLRSLDREVWQVTQRVRLPDVDSTGHLAIGPSGVFLLDSRAWQGVVTVDHKGATITPDGRPGAAWTAGGQRRSLAPAAATFARSASAVAGSTRPSPRAVVVIWAKFPERLAISGGVTYVAGDLLAEWLSGRTPRIDRPTRLGSRTGDRLAGRSPCRSGP